MKQSRSKHMADVSRNRKLRNDHTANLLEATASTQVLRYCEAYATRLGVTYALLICVMSTSGRIHGEFLLYVLAQRRTTRWFAQLGDDHSSDEAFKFRRGQSFWHSRATIGHAAALVGRAYPTTPCVAPELRPYKERPPVSTYRTRGYPSASAWLACFDFALVSRLFTLYSCPWPFASCFPNKTHPQSI